MESIIAFFIVPWVFITCISILVIIGFFMAEFEKFGWNTVFVILMLLLLQLNYNIFEHFMESPLMYFLYVLAYIAVGVIWSFVKWYSKLSKHARKIKKVKKERGDEWNDPNFAKDIAAILPGVYLYTNEEDLQTAIEKSFPELSNNKANITGWIIYWPFSLVATLFNDPVKRIANYLFELFSAAYAKIKDHIVKSI